MSRRHLHFCRLPRWRALYQRAIATAYRCLFRTSTQLNYYLDVRIARVVACLIRGIFTTVFCFRLEFLMGEHVLPRDITVYQAVQQFGGQVRPHPLPGIYQWVSLTKIVTLNAVADSHHFSADPDQPDPAFHFNAVSGSGSCSSSTSCESATTGLQTLQSSILSLNAFLLGFHGFYFKHLKLLNFYFYVDPDPQSWFSYLSYIFEWICYSFVLTKICNRIWPVEMSKGWFSQCLLSFWDSESHSFFPVERDSWIWKTNFLKPWFSLGNEIWKL